MTGRGCASLALAGLLAACSDGSDRPAGAASGPVPAPAEGQTIYSVAHGCFSIATAGQIYLVADSGGEQFEWQANAEASASRFRLQPADLGVYLLYDEQGRYLTSDGSALHDGDDRQRIPLNGIEHRLDALCRGRVYAGSAQL